jgi:hypothetical protein
MVIGLRFLIVVMALLFVALPSAPAAGATSPSDEPTPAVAPVAPATLLGPAPPYVPRKTDVSLEVGLLHADEDLLWVGGNFGAHVGHCIFSESQTCQQYVDGIVGAGVREGETVGLYLASLRWQYVNFPDRFSPFWRVFAGVANVADPGEHVLRAMGGGGVGITTYLHEKIDLRLEARAGYYDRGFAEGLVGFQIKVDELLLVFASKLRDLGLGTVKTAIEVGGTAVKATTEGVGGIVQGVEAPFKADKSKSGSPPEATPQPK